MKKIIYLLVFLISYVGYSQTPPPPSGIRKVNVTSPFAITIENTDFKNISNLASPNGTISFKITGGNKKSGVIPYEVTWELGGIGFTPNPANISISTNGEVTLTNLNIGTYTATIKDATCTIPATVAFTLYNFLKIDPTQTNIKCFGANDGTIDLSISGGSGANTVKWNTGESTPNRIGLVAGVHTYTIKDDKVSGTIDQSKANGMIVEGTITILAPPSSLIPTLSKIAQPSPGNNKDGILSLNVTGGYGAYTYVWKKDNVEMNPQPTVNAFGYVNGLDNGKYKVTVTDKGVNTGDGCPIDSNEIELKALNVNIPEPTPITCQGSTTNLTAIASGGTGTINYDWYELISTNPLNEKLLKQTNPSLNNIKAGTYIIKVTDADNNTTSSTIVVPDSPNEKITATTSKTDVNCNGGSDGSANIKISNAIANTPYEFRWYKETAPDTRVNLYDNITSQVTESTISSLVAGKYIVTASNGFCTESFSFPIITQPISAVTINDSTPIDATGFGLLGSITAAASGGTPAYDYQWYKGQGVTKTILTGEDKALLTAVKGTYSVIVTDAIGCTSEEKAFIIGEPDKLEVDFSGDSNLTITDPQKGLLKCFDASGVLTATPRGGKTDTTGYSFSWAITYKDGGTATSNSSFVNAKAGTYIVTIKDNAIPQNEIIKTITVTENSKLTINDSTPIDATGFGLLGSITAAASGGTPTYNYQWYTGQGVTKTILTGEDKALLTAVADTYSVIATDANGCTSEEKAFTINEPDELKVVFSGDSNLTITTPLTGLLKCFDGSGVLTAIPSGGKTNATGYSFSWEISYQDGGTATSNSSFVNAKAGSYIVTIKDNAIPQNEKQVTFIVSQPTEIQIKEATVAVKKMLNCFGDNDGKVSVSVSGGTPFTAGAAYNYIWKKLNTQNGKYEPIGTDNPTQTGLFAGTYSVEVHDANYDLSNPTNCIGILNDIIIDQPEQLKFSYTSNNISCFNGDNGTIKLNISGGTIFTDITKPYKIISNGGIVDALNRTITGLIAGKYTIYIIDANGCETSKQIIEISEPADALAFNPSTIVNASGFGLSNGSITLDITGGRPNYQYKWYNGSVVDSAQLISNTTKTISSLKAGFYTALVEDTNPFGTNCTITKTFEIKQPEELKLTVVPTIAYCNNGLGSLLATASGGTEIEQLQSERVYTYTLLDSTDKVLQTLSGNTANFTARPSGDYKVIAIDNKNNQTAPFATTLSQPTPIEVSLNGTQNVTCFNGNDGSLSITVKGGTPLIENSKPVYTYEWKKDGIVINMNNNLSPFSLKSGNYSVKVFDGNYNSNEPNFCIGTLENIIITQPADFGFDLDKIVPTIPTAKNAFDGALHIEIVGGIAPYTYVCTDSKNNTIETKASIPNKQADFLSLTTDNYTVSVTDATGCTKSTAFDFNNNVLTITTTQTTQVTCNNGSDAALNASVIGGFGVKTISWYKNNVLIPNETTATLTNSSIGSYYAVVKDFNKVEVTSNTIIVTQPNAIIVTTTQKEISCLGFNDGNINLSAIGGSNTFQYRFRVSGNPYSSWIPFEKTTTATLSNLKAGAYNIQIQDNKGCNYTSNLDITLSEPVQLNISKSTITTTTGFNVANGSISITAQGGNGGYLYKWFDSANTQLNQTTATLTNVLAGKYYVIITDNKGCQFNSPLYEITQPDKLLVNLSLFNSVLCNGDKNASLKTTTTGGIAGYTYQWFNINSPNKIGTGTTLPTIGAGTYYVIVTDSKNNITKSDSFIVTEPAILNNTLSSEYTRCGDAKDWTITTAPIGGTAPYTYLWNTGEKTAALLDVIPGTYSVLVTDNNGCSITKNITITAPVHLATAETITKPTCFEGSDATIVLTSSGGQAPYTYLWNTGEKSNTLSNASAKVYSVAVTDFKGCVIDKTYTIENPPKDVINLGEDVTLCFDQSLTINSTIADDKAKYAWTSTKGFKSDKPIITVSEPAEYTLVVTNRLGCTATDMLKISKQETAISAEFAVSSQVFVNEKFIIVDISNPIADGIEWSLPAEATVVSKNKDFAELSFSKVGEYELTLNTKKGNCTATQTKKIVVIEGEYVDPDSTDLKKKFDLKIYPNPSSGIFTVDVTLDKIMPAHIKVYNLNNNAIIDSKYEEGKDAYTFNFSLSGLTSGVYFVLVESQQGNQLRKIIIK